jgi:murein DD-endopeptidase MepM/ murein hydrolase activator NlpD
MFIIAHALAAPIALVALTGCGIAGGASATATPTSTATIPPTATAAATQTPTATPLPTETSTPEPTVTVAPEPTAEPAVTAPTPAPPRAPNLRVLPQGGTIVVRASATGAASARTSYRGDDLAMLSDGTSFWVVIGASSGAQLGDFVATVTRYDDAGGVLDTTAELRPVVPTEYPVEYITLPPGQIEGLPIEGIQLEINIRAETFARFTPVKLWNGPFLIPAAGPITGNFGDGRSYNGGPVASRHSGTDFGADEGAPVVASAPGRVAFAGYLATRGNSVIVDHGAGVFTGYHHMSRIDVAAGQDMAVGQQVGAVGATGLATGPHLHWELIVGGVNVDALRWTRPEFVP